MAANSNTSANRRIYFPGPDIVVTSVVIKTGEGTYPVRDLIIEDPQYFYAFPASRMALFTGMVELLLGLGVAAVYGSAYAFLIAAGVVAAIGMATAVLVDYHHNPSWMELTAVYEGRRVVLFASRDRRTFEQVRRAVVRSVEANRGPRP